MKTGVLVMAHGTPSSPEGIEAFYTRIRRGSAPTPELLADLTRRYLAIGGVSPLTERTTDQVAGVAEMLDVNAPGSFDVRYGSKFEPPLLEEAAASFRRDGFTNVVGIVLAPHSSSMSTEQYMSRARSALGDDVTFIAVGAWYDAPGFLTLIAERVNAALATIPASRHATTEVIFSAHSLPQRVVTLGDTYPEQLKESAVLAAEIAGVASFDVAWQSAGRTADPWLGPDILVALREKRALGFTDVVSCPIGFVSDHLEVLFDIDIEAQSVAREVGLNLVRTASLHDDPAFMSVLANVIRTAAGT
ncbi:MAG TPA: ferrochelatase [Acidimicrobiales bacterium]|nr:ferrochelatase [Acidimicrobiales bacterium]